MSVRRRKGRLQKAGFLGIVTEYHDVGVQADLLEYRAGRYCCAQVDFNVDMLDLVADGRERTVEQGEQARVSDGKVELGKINLPESTNGKWQDPGSDQASRSQPEGCSPVDEDACPVVGYDGELNAPEPELEAIAGSSYIDTSDDEHFNNEKGGNSNRIPAVNVHPDDAEFPSSVYRGPNTPTWRPAQRSRSPQSPAVDAQLECPVSTYGGEPNSRSEPDFESMALDPWSPYMCGSEDEHSSNQTDGNSNCITADVDKSEEQVVNSLQSSANVHPDDAEFSSSVYPGPNTPTLRPAKRLRSPRSPAVDTQLECPGAYGGEPNSRSKPDFGSMAVDPGSPYMCGSDNGHSSNHTNGNSNGIAVDAPDVRAVDAQPKDGKASLRVEPNTLPVRFAKRARSKSPKSPLRRLKDAMKGKSEEGQQKTILEDNVKDPPVTGRSRQNTRRFIRSRRRMLWTPDIKFIHTRPKRKGERKDGPVVPSKNTQKKRETRRYSIRISTESSSTIVEYKSGVDTQIACGNTHPHRHRLFPSPRQLDTAGKIVQNPMQDFYYGEPNIEGGIIGVYGNFRVKEEGLAYDV
ncbi:hypothetical protein B0H13DRAFT_1911253 [Mycena leptocephala]|nr:hypothetical protein B0H13DRAFT_1911253 [Mycena leptocephala]